MKPQKSWAKSGTTPIVVGCSQPGVNQSLCMAIDYMQGIVKYKKVVSGSYNATSFSDFIKELISNIHPVDNTVLIFDNSRIHKEELIKAACKEICEVKFLSPYSPMFNPVENVFGTTKGKIKKMLNNDTYRERVRYGFFFYNLYIFKISFQCSVWTKGHNEGGVDVRIN
jgi:transposase